MKQTPGSVVVKWPVKSCMVGEVSGCFPVVLLGLILPDGGSC